MVVYEWTMDGVKMSDRSQKNHNLMLTVRNMDRSLQVAELVIQSVKDAVEVLQ